MSLTWKHYKSRVKLLEIILDICVCCFVSVRMSACALIGDQR